MEKISENLEEKSFFLITLYTIKPATLLKRDLAQIVNFAKLF